MYASTPASFSLDLSPGISITRSSLNGICPGSLPPQLLGKPKENSLRPPDVAEPVHVFILDYFADELRATLAESREYVVEVRHGEHDAQVTKGVYRGVPMIRHDRWFQES